MGEIEAAERYDSWFESNETLFESEARAIEAVLPEGWDRAVEIGCGTGLFADRLGVESGIEPSEPMADRARGRGIDVTPGTAEDVPLEDETVDLGLMLGVLGYVDDVDTALSELSRVVEPGGWAVVAFLQADVGFATLYDRAVERGSYPDDLDWEDPYPLAMAEQANWRTAGDVLDRLRTVGFTDLEAVQTLTRPPEEAISNVESPSDGHDSGSWVVVRARRAE